ncbi:MAG: response regulator transcription factor [Verrucomicrobiae bacterium]|nr:response regulator transcription factor [Verrucomicrobiae bacterium]
MQNIRTVVIEDITLLRELIINSLKSDPQFEIVGQAADGHQALELIRSRLPDMLILDLMLPGLAGVEVLKRFFKLNPKGRVLVVTGYENPALVREVLEAGAQGFIEKSASLEDMVLAIKKVAHGESYLGNSVAQMLRDAAFSKNNDPVPLTSREREALQMIAEGKSTKEIADIMKISVNTARNHRANLMAKLNIHDISSLTRYAIKMGIATAR